MLLLLYKDMRCSHVRRSYIPELLPKFVSLLADAERTGNYEMVRLEVWGCVGRVGRPPAGWKVDGRSWILMCG